MATTQTNHVGAYDSRLARLLQYLEADPGNLNLLTEAASHALDTGQHSLCRQFLAQYEAQTPLPPNLINLRGLLNLSEGHFTDALACFRSLESQFAGPVLRYNVAYAYAMLGQYADAAQALELDDNDPELLPESATLKIRALHHLGRLDEAIEVGQRWMRAPHPDVELAGALATVSFDASQVDMARAFADLAPPESADGLTVRGLLALEGGADDEARAVLEQAIRLRPSSARAKLGLGLCHLARRNLDTAANLLGEAAESMGSHAGSWVALGWAHLLRGDLVSASNSFTRAWDLDRGFAEAPGGLAVVCVHQKQAHEARRLATTALRLDKDCMSAAFALSLIAGVSGDETRSVELIGAAMDNPIDARGTTLRRLMQRRMARATYEDSAT